MDRSECRAIVEAELTPLMARLGVGHWRVTVAYDPSGVNGDGELKHGECTRMVDYESAAISLNPESFDDPNAVLRTLRHELFHIVLAPYDLYSSAVDRALEGQAGALGDVLDRVWCHASETAVIALERMFAGLTSPAAESD